MRKWWKKRKNRRRLFQTLIYNYFLFNIALFFIFVATAILFITDFSKKLEKIENYDLNIKTEAKSYTDRAVAEQLISELARTEGWLEVLDKERRVISTHGKKKDQKNVYSDEELYLLLANETNQTYYYSLALYQDEPNARYLLLKIPRKNVVISNEYESIPNVQRLLWMSVMRNFVIFLGLIVMFIAFYSYWTSKKIVRPLENILKGLKQMIEGNYKTRLSINAEREFIQIRDTFNYMADQLEKTEREKQQLEESKKNMLVAISHDLKTPITSIQGYTQALHDEVVVDPVQQKRYIGFIFKKTERVATLIENLFELLKLDAPDYHLQLKKQEIGEFLREVVVDHYAELESSGFELDLQIPEDNVYALFDQEHMARVMSNLLANAVKYNPAGTRLRVELIEENTHVTIQVADTGVGISKQLWDTIFDPFVRGDESRSSIGGTGLGLSIVKQIIAKHGGTITLTSTDVEATIFTIQLKRA